MGRYVEILPDALTATASTEKITLGARTDVDGERYRFVRYNTGAGNVTAVASNLCYWLTVSTYSVTSDVSDSDQNLVAGVLLSAPAHNEYAWIKTRGFVSAVKATATMTKGDCVIAHATLDGQAGVVAGDTAPTNQVVGWVTANNSSGTNVATYVCID